MLDYWVDIETSGGARVGDGPITTAVGWESEDKLDRLGAFSFEMPASDARAALCTAKRVARCRTIRDGAVVDLGAGIIDKVTAQARTDGPAMLRVEGPNLVGELTYRSVGTLEMAARNVRDPDRIEWFEPAATFRSMWTWLTANANGGATSLTVTSSAGFIVGEAITLDLDGGGTHITTVAAIPDGTHINLVDAIPGVATPAATSGNQVWRSAATGYSPVTLSTDDFWYVGDAATFNTITITVNGTNPPGSSWTGNIHKATTVLEYWNGAAWAAIADFRDGTISLAHTGIITFAAPADWGLTTVDGANLYWVRLSYTDEGTSDVWVADLQVDTVGPDYDTPNSIMALAPAGWTLGGDLTTLAGTSGVFNGENLLEALIRVAELTGEHFRLGTGRQVIWLNVATTASGARAVRAADPVEMEGETDACLITVLQHSSDTHDLLTRIYPHAAGDGESVLTLEKTTRSAPAGYTLDKTNNYLKHDATETTYGQIERWIFESDVRPVDTSQQAAIDAANQLYDATKLRLDRAIAAVEAYSLTVTKLDQALNVGTTIRVIYDEWVDGYHAVAIDSNLVVLGATTQIDQAGARTVALDVASSAWWPKSDLEQLVQEQRATRQYTRHVQKVPATAIDALEVSAMKTLVTDGQGGATWMELERPVTSTYTAGPHNLFSAPHADTTGAASPVDGDIVIANATPKWSKLAISVPAANVLNVLGVANGELRPSWKTLFDATDPTTLTVSTAAAPGTSLLAAHCDHAHAITSSSNPGAAASLLASDASGLLQLTGLGVGMAGAAAWLKIAGQLSVTSATYPPAQAECTSALTNTTATGMAIRHKTSGDMADGFGPALAFLVMDDALANNLIGQIIAERSGADNSGRLALYSISAGSGVRFLTGFPSGGCYLGPTPPSDPGASSLRIVNYLGVGVAPGTVRLYATEADYADVAKLERTTASTTGAFVSARIVARSSGNATDDFGALLEFCLTDTGVTDAPLGYVGAVRSGADNSGRVSLYSTSAGTAVICVSGYPSGGVHIGNSPADPNADNLYVESNCSALTFTDRTPMPASLQEAYAAVASVRRRADGAGLDHLALHPSLQSLSPDGQLRGRNLSALVSAQAEVIQDLISRIRQLEAA